MMTYIIIVILFTLGFLLGALFSRNKECVSCSSREVSESRQYQKIE